MGMLEGLEPQRVLHYFEEICAIPHGSGDTDRISAYCVNFAKEHHLPYRQDEYNNVLMWKPASVGYEDHPTVIIQGHMDMVCEKEPENPIDFTKDGLRLGIDGDWIHANGTTLGGDDGIALAMAMAVLEDDTLPHPPLEVLFTTDEETGMDGAVGLDMSDMKGKLLLNLDSEEEGVITAGCAGGARTQLYLPVEITPCDASAPAYTVTVTGLIGGHSGAEIDKGRLNASVVMGQFLATLPEGVRIASIVGGSKDNAIPRQTVCVVTGIDNPQQAADSFVKSTRVPTDPDLAVTIEPAEGVAQAVTAEDSRRMIRLLCTVKNGIQAMSRDIPGAVQTSLNLGILELENGEMLASFAVRSSINSEKEALIKDLEDFIVGMGGHMSVHGVYPAWEFKEQSDLRDKMMALYQSMFEKTPTVEVVHGGLECGLFSDRIPGLDAVSIGPDMLDIHTSRERLNIPSTERTYRFLCRLLEEL